MKDNSYLIPARFKKKSNFELPILATINTHIHTPIFINHNVNKCVGGGVIITYLKD